MLSALYKLCLIINNFFAKFLIGIKIFTYPKLRLRFSKLTGF